MSGLRLSAVRSAKYLSCPSFYAYSNVCYNKYMQVQALHTEKKSFSNFQRTLFKKHVFQMPSLLKIHQRHFWGLEAAFNKVDEERVKLAGPDRAAAEWILRNEGSLKWKNTAKHLKDYNALPSTDFQNYKIEEIDLTATNVVGLGFEHLENLQHVKSIKLHGCRTIRDDALGHLHFVQDTLQYLDVSRCPMITESGLEQLHCLKNLKDLVIYDLIEIKHFDKVIARLSKAMPWCKIDTEDPLNKTDNSKEER